MRYVLSETKPFFLTTELAAVVVVLVALGITAASSDSLDARLGWPLATAIVAAFVFSRGLAKGGAASTSWDPREELRPAADGRDDNWNEGRSAGAAPYEDGEATRVMSTVGSREDYETQQGYRPAAQPYGYGYGYGRGRGMGGIREMFPIETKPFFLTSEFWGTIALIAGLAIAAGTSEDVDARLFWILATAITIGYVISRGIAKSGTKSRSWDPREEGMQRLRERVSRDDDR